MKKNESVHFLKKKLCFTLFAGQKLTAVQTDNSGEFKASNGGSYKCVAKQHITLQNNVKVDLSDFQYRAFGNTAMDDFPTDGKTLLH